MPEPRRADADIMLRVKGLNVYYGRSHALQGVDLTLAHGVLSVVGRNGMGKTTLCKAIMGLARASSGSIRVRGEEMLGLPPARVARHGVGYVPQGRRLWRSLTVDEHLRMTTARQSGAWTVERVYDVFPRLAERKNNSGAQLSGGEQQMLAISRALITNPRLLIMDEPTEGLAPVIVSQVEEMLVRLGEESDMAILVIEQNIGVATTVSENVAIMVNGRINRIIEFAAARGRPRAAAAALGRRPPRRRRAGSRRRRRARSGGSSAERRKAGSGADQALCLQPDAANAVVATGSQCANRGERPHRSRPAPRGSRRLAEPRPARPAGSPVVLVVGTLDTKGTELRFIRDLIVASGLRARLVDVSTSGKLATCDVTAQEIALNHGRGGVAVFGRERGASVSAMAEAFEAWIKRQNDVAGIISAGGSGGASIVAPGMRALPIGAPKVLVSSIASGDVGPYVGPTDITMMYSVTDVQGLNAISRQVLANGAQALIGMVKARLSAREESGAGRVRRTALPSVGLTMFGVTTPCVQQITAALAADWECLVFHATGVGGRSMEKLVDSGLISAVIDVTTTEVADMLMGGVLAADEDRFGAIIRTRAPYVGSVGALDMVNFGPIDTVPAAYKGRLLHVHNPQVTLMRTTAAENDRIGSWIGERLNRMDGPVRFLLPELGVSALDAPGQAFHDPRADAALFARARTDGASDREPAIDPGQAPHQRSRVLRRCRRRVPGAARTIGRAPARGEMTMSAFDRSTLMDKFRAMAARGEPIVGGGAGVGLSAKCEEAGGVDLIVIYNSGRYRMAGRGSLAGLLAYGDANAIVVDMAREVLPVVKRTPVLAGVNGTDPFRRMDVFLDEIKALGFAGVQNFPTVGLIDGIFRANLEETGMSYGLEVDMIAKAREKDLLTTPYVFNAGEAEAMAKAGADILVCHLGLTTGGAIGAQTAPKLKDCPALIDAWASAALKVRS